MKTDKETTLKDFILRDVIGGTALAALVVVAVVEFMALASR